MIKLSLEDKILLQFGNKRKNIQPHEIDADSSAKEIALFHLVKRGYGTAHENGSSKYERYISVSITAEGKERQKELFRLMNRSRHDWFCDGIGYVWRNVKPSTIRIVEEVIGGAILALLSFWLGRVTAP